MVMAGFHALQNPAPRLFLECSNLTENEKAVGVLRDESQWFPALRWNISLGLEIRKMGVLTVSGERFRARRPILELVVVSLW